MNIMADECVDRQIVEILREEGHDVLYIAEIDPSISDDIVFERANQQNALLLTADKDFGELVFRQNKILNGVLFFRLAGLSQLAKAKIISSVVQEHSDKLYQSFTVVSPGIVRIREGIR